MKIINLFNEDAVTIYKLVLVGKEVKKFPGGFWEQPEALQNAIKIVRWLIDEELKLSSNDIKKQISKDFFIKHKLAGMLKHVFDNKPSAVISIAYPERNIKEWEFATTSKTFWKEKDNRVKATKWLVEEKLEINIKKKPLSIKGKDFINNSLAGLLSKWYNGSAISALIEAYPEEEFQVWDFATAPQGYWKNKENGIKAAKWLIEEKYKMTDEDIKSKICQQLFIDNNLNGMYQISFGNSTINILEELYPGKYNKSDLIAYKKNGFAKRI